MALNYPSDEQFCRTEGWWDSALLWAVGRLLVCIKVASGVPEPAVNSHGVILVTFFRMVTISRSTYYLP